MKNLNILKDNAHYPFFLTLLLAFLISGCGVSTSEYTTLQNQYNILDSEKLALEDDAQKLQMKADSLEKENSQLTAQKEAQSQAQMQTAATMQKMIDSLKEEIEDKTVQISMMQDTLKVDLIGKVFFESGSAEVTKEGREILSRIGPILKEASEQEVRIVGHCDDRPIGDYLKEKYLTNWELSTARSTSIVHILQWGYQIEPGRLVAQGVAHYRPRVVETKENRQLNRVVEILVAPLDESQLPVVEAVEQ